MKWAIPEILPISTYKLDYSTRSFWMGSCFAENMSSLGQELGFSFEQTKFGTLFHPSVIAKILNNSLNKNELDSFFVQRSGHYYSWLASTRFNAPTPSELQLKWNEEINAIHDKLTKSEFLFITFGTSYAYRLNENGQLVANCHKMPAAQFTKELISLETMKAEWIDLLPKLKDLNPNLKIVLTVSPVRHLRDGVVENMHSKARLLELVHSLKSEFGFVSYFPAYEIMMDELRDYRFYKDDLIHPSNLAIQEIWQRFKGAYFTEETNAMVDQMQQFRSFFSHIDIQTKETSIENHPMQLKLNDFLANNPEVKWKK